MIALNLLPLQNKKEIETAVTKELAISLILWISILLIIFSFILASIFLYVSVLLRYQSQLMESKHSDSKMLQLSEIESLIVDANKKISQVYDKQSKSIYWTVIIEELDNIVPDGIYLHNFSYQAKINQINLNGWARTRSKLLAFQESLENSSFFHEIESPLSNLLKQNDIEFNLTLKPILEGIKEF